MRHTAASLMLNNGIPAIVVSRRLGHAKTSITQDRYGHMIQGAEEQAVSLMDDLVVPVGLHQDAPDERKKEASPLYTLVVLHRNPLLTRREPGTPPPALSKEEKKRNRPSTISYQTRRFRA